MKRLIALFCAAALLLSTAGCGSELVEADDLMQDVQNIVLSRSESEPLVPETEFPLPEDEDALAEPSSEKGVSSETEASAPAAPPAAQAGAEAAAPVVSSTVEPPAPPSRQEQPPASSQPPSSQPEEEAEEETVASPSVTGEVRAMWFSYFDLAPLIKGRSAGQFEKSIGEAFENCRQMGLNTMIVQVRPHGDAFYPSQYFPWSHWIDPNDREGNDPGYDPLKIMVNQAHARGLKIEAWVNPYRIRTSSLPLSGDNPAQRWLDEGSDNVIAYNGGLYYNPARKEAQQLIVNGVKEIVQNYAVDGIHFDDYFYPAPDDFFDQDSYDEYRSGGGTLGRGDWRRENVDALVKAVYKTVKSGGKSLLFGISPQGNRNNNYSMQYINVERWVSGSGYVDYICPQIYWGFDSQAAPFSRIAAEWEQVVEGSGVKLYIGLAAYKIDTAENDFSGCTDLMMRQVLESRELGRYGGFALFRYDSMFHPAAGVKSNVEQEIENLQSILD